MKIRIHGIDFNVDDRVDRVFWEAVDAGTWENAIFDVVDRYVPLDGTVFDIGCWIGPVSLYAAARGATVHSIDPDPAAIKRLTHKFALNPTFSSRIFPHPLAISPTGEAAILYARDRYGASSSSLLERTGDHLNDVEIEGVMLDEFLEMSAINRPDLIKMDVEGGGMRSSSGYGTGTAVSRLSTEFRLISRRASERTSLPYKGGAGVHLPGRT